jgi:phospholipase/carboxylesterase
LKRTWWLWIKTWPDRPLTKKFMHYIYQPAGQPATHTLLLLHGTGGDEHDLLPLGKDFGKGFNILSLRGNVLEGGMPRFFKRLGMGVFDEKDVTFRTQEMIDFIKDLGPKEGFDPHNLIALGYSNGANIAGSTLVLYPDFLAGAILFRPMQPFRSIDPTLHTDRQVPIFMSNGNQDPTINPADTKHYVSILEKAGFDVSAHTLSAGHGLVQEDLMLAKIWVNQHFMEARA